MSELQCNRETLFPLLAGVLDGEQDATFVLADLLEEQGHSAAAERARHARSRPRKRLNFALLTVPFPVLVPLCCDYIEHVIEASPEAYEPWSPIRETLQQLRHWYASGADIGTLATVASQIDVVSARDEMTQHHGKRPGAERSAKALNACWLLADVLWAFINAQAESLPNRRTHRIDNARALVLNLATTLRINCGPMVKYEIDQFIAQRIRETKTPLFTSLTLPGWMRDTHAATAGSQSEMYWQVKSTRDWLLEHVCE